MKRLKCSCVLALLFTVVSLGIATNARAEKITYDLNQDWSDSQNPNGVWSYNQGNLPISVHQQFWWGQSGWGYLWIGDGCMIKGFDPAGLTDPWGNVVPPAFDWQPGDVMMHALSIPYGGDSTFLNVNWTSPGDGMIDISGHAWDGEIFADRDVAWVLSIGGRPIAQRDSVIGLHRNDAAAQFESNLLSGNSLTHVRIKKGDVVEFRVIAKTYYGHFLGISETITFLGARVPITPPGIMDQQGRQL